MPRITPKGLVVTKTFRIYRSTDTGQLIEGLSLEDPIEITVKQASRKTHAVWQEYRRDATDNDLTWDKDENGKDRSKRSFKAPTQIFQETLDIWLGLTDCNLQNEDGKTLFVFRGEGIDRRPDDTFSEFSKKLDLLPIDWVAEMWDRVLFLNPQWGESAYIEDDDVVVDAKVKK